MTEVMNNVQMRELIMDADMLRKLQQYDKKLNYIKAYNKEHKDEQNERTKKYHAKMKSTDDWKRKKQEYYQNVLKPRQQEKARLKREAKEQARANTPKARL
jgi:hypothetical protein